MFKRLAIIFLLLSCGFLARPAQAQLIADSVAEFSGTQGAFNWQYGYYANSAVSSSFTQFTIFDNNVWLESQTAPPYTALFDVGGHPGGANYFPAPEHWAVRRYTAEVGGDLLLEGLSQNGTPTLLRQQASLGAFSAMELRFTPSYHRRR